MSYNLISVAVAVGMNLASVGAFAQTAAERTGDVMRYQATDSGLLRAHRKHRKIYYGVGFGGHRRTTATGGNAGGYSDRN